MARSVIALAVFLLVVLNRSVACDACGCSVNGAGIGLTAVYRQNYVGIQYQYAPFRSTLEHAHGAIDYFHSFELTARLRVLRRINLQLQQPYRINIRRHPDGDADRSGLGDTRFIAHYVLFDQRQLGGGFRLYFEAGIGVKAPVGHFDPTIQDDHNLPENFNPGNGSWAGLLQSNLVLGRNKAGLALSGNYQLNGASTSGYRFGNQWSGQALVFNQFMPGSVFSFTPFCGVAAEGVGQDVQSDGRYAASTGGNGWFLAAGLNLKIHSWLLGTTYSRPFSQHYSNAEVKAGARYSINVLYFF